VTSRIIGTLPRAAATSPPPPPDPAPTPKCVTDRRRRRARYLILPFSFDALSSPISLFFHIHFI